MLDDDAQHRYIVKPLTGFGVQIKIANPPGKKIDHHGIKVQLLGQIELATERGHPQDFLGLGAANMRCISTCCQAPVAESCLASADCYHSQLFAHLAKHTPLCCPQMQHQ